MQLVPMHPGPTNQDESVMRTLFGRKEIGGGGGGHLINQHIFSLVFTVELNVDSH